MTTVLLHILNPSCSCSSAIHQPQHARSSRRPQHRRSNPLHPRPHSRSHSPPLPSLIMARGLQKVRPAAFLRSLRTSSTAPLPSASAYARITCKLTPRTPLTQHNSDRSAAEESGGGEEGREFNAEERQGAEIYLRAYLMRASAVLLAFSFFSCLLACLLCLLGVSCNSSGFV